MKRVLATIAATVAGLGALLSYKSGPTRKASLAVSPSSGASALPGAPAVTTPAAPAAPGVGAGGDGSGEDGGLAPPPTAATPAAPATTTAPLPSGSKVLTGPDVPNQYGDVQVQVTLQGGKIVDVKSLVLPTDRQRSAYISQVAGPLLRTEVLQAQSANIDIISGATYTSESYAQSVQAALDSARQ